MFSFFLSNPKRTFALVAILFVYGIYCGLSLPISMYPSTSKPSVNMWIPYGTFSAKSFRNEFGNQIESRIKKISNSSIKVDKVDAFYNSDSALYEVEFDWGTPFDLAKKEIELVSTGIAGSLPKSISDRIGVWQRNKNSGFFAASLYSPDKSLKELYNEIEPILSPELNLVLDADNPVIWNPENYIINIRLIPEKLASYGIFPDIIQESILKNISSYSGGKVKFGKKNQNFEINASINDLSSLELVVIPHNKKLIYLKDVAYIDYGRDLNRERSFKTNGINSLILFAKPKPGANVKKMSEDILEILRRKRHLLPDSLVFKVIVDPASTIKKSIENLIKDVFIASAMAVLVLYLFIGGFRNIGTAIIEIPLSMILSFIFMKYFDMNLNLISLGGLALAAGMNVDASIVIMENIFKHRDIYSKLGRECYSLSSRVELVSKAVSEVALPVILSIFTTLIVFLPMAFTSNLTNAILGDLARAVIFSHAISGIVALIVVPTVRVIVLKKYSSDQLPPLEKFLLKFEVVYEKTLLSLLRVKSIKSIVVSIPIILLTVLTYTLVPSLPKKIIGKPSTDWVYMYINDYSTNSGRHMENIMQEIEDQSLSLLEGFVDYTWLEKHSENGGQIMFKLFDRNNMKQAEKKLKSFFKNSSTRIFYISTWNPAELPLPKEYHFKARIAGQEKDVFKVASRLKAYILESNSYDRVSTNPSIKDTFVYKFQPYTNRWRVLNENGVNLRLDQIASVSSLSNNPLLVGQMDYEGKSTNIKMSLSDKRYTSPESLKAFPINIKNKIISLGSLGRFLSVKQTNDVLVRDGNVEVELNAVLENKIKEWESVFLKSKENIENNISNLIGKSGTKIEILYPQLELKESLNQLAKSLLLSLFLIFFILWMQFQSVKQVAIIMMTIPLGIIGVILSLSFFNSYLSLNSALGIILLNGITVNNSILLTDVTNSLRNKGLRGEDLILSATKKRLRAILITSLTTVLGLFPVALGIGDGGKIMQPLGISVVGGLLIATTLTLFVVPILLFRKEENIKEDIVGYPTIKSPDQKIIYKKDLV